MTLWNFTQDDLVNILNQMDYPEIRRYCFTNKYNFEICKKYQNIINNRLELYIDQLLVNLPTLIGYTRNNFRYYEDEEKDGTPFNYKGGYLKSLLPNHTFHLKYDDEPIFIGGNWDRGGKFILTNDK